MLLFLLFVSLYFLQSLFFRVFFVILNRSIFISKIMVSDEEKNIFLQELESESLQEKKTIEPTGKKKKRN